MPIPVSGFVYNSSQEVLNEFFFGVAFEGSDIIFHQGGLEKRNAQKTSIFSPEEGSYVYCHRSGNEVQISTDPSGLCKLYVYERGNDWAISDSFYELCVSVKNLGWPLNPNLASIHSTRITGWFGDQLLSFNTIFDEISLLPHWKRIIIKDNKMIIQTSNNYDFRIRNPLSYRESLERHIVNSVSRVSTLLSEDRMEVISDITGGIDSRVPVSLLIGDGRIENLTFFSKPGDGKVSEDRDIAEKITNRFGLNHIHSYPVGARTLDYIEWKRRCLGIYPLFWFRSDYPIRIQRLTGKVGELYRDMYGVLWKGDAREFFSQYEELFPSSEIFSKAIEDFVNAVEMCKEVYENNVTDSLAHYRSFRNRFHYGQDLTLEFYSSVDLVRSFDIEYPVGGEKDYILFHDFIFNTCPELLEVEFDSEEKNFSKKQEERITKISIEGVNTGECYFDESEQFIFNNSTELRGPNFLRFFISEMMVDFEYSASNPIVEEILGEDYVNTARERLHSMHNSLRLSHGRHIKEINNVITLGKFLT